MSTLPQNYPYQELAFTKDGSPVDPGQAAAVGDLADRVSDLVVISHGWNNDMDEARTLYRDLFTSLDTVRARTSADLAGRTFGVVGILWPSKRFADADLIPGGAAGVGHSDAALAGDLRRMGDAFDSPDAGTTMEKAAALVDRLDESPRAQREFADLLRSLVTRDVAEPADAPNQLFDLGGPELMERLHTALLTLLTELPPAPGEAGGISAVPSGGAAGLGTTITRLWSRGRSLLNYLTYYEMKARAGTIGAASVAPVLHAEVTGRARLHLVGHSFGARLVTSAAGALPGSSEVASMSLLQAAFSHNAFADAWKPKTPGGFRAMVDARRIAGPMAITHTRNDKAVGIAYAMASSIAGQAASAIGDKDSPYGGLGSNGAQHTPEADDSQALQDLDAVYHFQPGRIHNLLADRFISGHGDVANVQVANAVLRTMLAAPTS
jgi:hypothetical protein